jgi:uncharacterized protein (TIGR03435 family)
VRCLSVLFYTALACSQTFDVASIRLSGPQSVRGSEGGPGTSDPGRYRFASATLMDLLAQAYAVDYSQLSSKTPLDRDRYDLIATIPAGATKEQFRVMLQNLLADRFRMKVHKETRDFPAYELVVAKGGAKLSASRPDSPDRPSLTTEFTLVNGQSLARTRARKMPLAAIERLLRVATGAPVIDRTGLTGLYDFTLEHAQAGGRLSETAPDAPVAPSIFTAVQQQFGLQLVSKKLPFDVIVVDSFDRVPSEN